MATNYQRLKKVDENDKPFLTDQEQLFLCAIWNSFTVDWVLRMKVTTTVNFFYIYQLPVPRLTKQDVAFRMIVERAAKLICTTPDFQELWESVMPDTVWSTSVAAIDSTDRAKLRTELDGIFAHVYGLNEEEFRYILGTFPLVSHTVNDAALDAFRLFALEPDDLALTELISKGENDWVEFKEAACWNARLNRKDDSMRDNVIQEVAAFLNSRKGGVVLIGVEDDGTILGLKDDIKAANEQKQNPDSYKLFLLDNLKNNLVSNCSLLYEISFGTLHGKDICRIDVTPSTEPVFTKGGDFYIREGNRKRKLSPQETFTYSKQRFT